MREEIPDKLLQHRDLIDTILADTALLEEINAIANTIIDCYLNEKKVLTFGCGGSAADSQHIAAEFISRLNFNRAGLPAIALTTDTSILTAIGNDYSFDKIFSRQVEALADEGDVVIGISTSGKSKVVLDALNSAREKKAHTVFLTGKTPENIDVDHRICIPSDVTTLIQEAHILIAHIICGIVEDELFNDPQ